MAIAWPELTPGAVLPLISADGIEVVVVDDRRAAGVLDVDQRAQRHALAVGVADLQLADVLDAHAVARVGLDVDLPVAVLEGEVVDVGRAEVGLQRRCARRRARRSGP